MYSSNDLPSFRIGVYKQPVVPVNSDFESNPLDIANNQHELTTTSSSLSNWKPPTFTTHYTYYPRFDNNVKLQNPKASGEISISIIEFTQSYS